MKRLIAATEMTDLRKIMKECKEFDNWKFPEADSLQQEYNVEYKYHTIDDLGDIWPTFEHFSEAARNGSVVELSQAEDFEIYNRSRLATLDELISLVSSYRSWPEFRNMDTMAGIISGFTNNTDMTMPIVLNVDGNKQIFSGNTRLDVAFMMNVTPKVLIIDVNLDEFL